MAYRRARATSGKVESTSKAERTPTDLQSSVGKVGHVVGAEMVSSPSEVEAMLRAEPEILREVTTIGVGVDCNSIPMEKPHAEPVGRPRKDAPKTPVEVVYCMARRAPSPFTTASAMRYTPFALAASRMRMSPRSRRQAQATLRRPRAAARARRR